MPISFRKMTTYFGDNVHLQVISFKYYSSEPEYMLNAEVAARTDQLLYQKLKIKPKLTAC